MSSTAPENEPSKKPPLREISYQHSRNLPALLEQLNASLLISTYQAGKIAALSAHEGKLNLEFHNFDRPMGLAISPGQIAVGARNQIWFLDSAPQIAPQLPRPSGEGRGEGFYDACFLARHSHVTGEIQCHEMAFAPAINTPATPASHSPSAAPHPPNTTRHVTNTTELWIVNTLFSCLCTLDSKFNFVPRWRPLFISALAAEDRCHLNGLALQNGQPKYVTCMAETDTAAGWRPNKVTTGCLIDVAANQTVARGFAMPHSPRIYNGQVWLLDSGRGHLARINPATGQHDVVASVPGYSRGLAMHNNLAFIGLSKIRETSTFGGVPIAEKRDELRCGIGVIELPTGRTIATFEFTTGVEEIFDVSILPGIRRPALRGPHCVEDGHPTIWIVPTPQ